MAVLDRWECRFKSHWRHGCASLCFCYVLQMLRPVPFADHLFRGVLLCVCVCVCVCVYWIVCHLEAQQWDGLGPVWAVAQQKNDNILFKHVQYIFNQSWLHVSITSCYLQTLKCQYKRALQMHFMNNRGILCTYNTIKYYGMDSS